MLKDEAGPVDPVGVFGSEARPGGINVFTREVFFPSGLLEKGDEVANLVDSFWMEKRAERPLLSRAKTRSSLVKDLGVLVLAFPHLKSTATSWSEKVFEGRPPHTSNRPPPTGQGEGGIKTFA